MDEVPRLQRLRKDPHVWHLHHMDDLLPLFENLRVKGRLPRGGMQQMHEDTNIPIDTLKGYRKHLLKDPEWMPYLNLGVTTLPPYAEIDLANWLRYEIANDHALTLGDLQDKAVDKYRELDANEVRRDYFAASHRWAARFMMKHRFSLRSGHPAKRGQIDPFFVGAYIKKLRNAIRKYPEDLIFNMDETCIHTVNQPRFVIAPIGADSVPCGNNGNPKECFTCIGTISYSGAILPPWFVGKNSTNVFPRQWETNVDIQLTKSKNGWTDGEVMIEYLNWLHLQSGKRACALILDVFSAHRLESVKEKARELNIELIFVPANGTSIYQPLDRSIFGILKRKLVRSWELCRRRNRETEVWNKRMAGLEVIKILSNIDSNHVKNSWRNIPEINSNRYDNQAFDDTEDDVVEDDPEFQIDFIYDEDE